MNLSGKRNWVLMCQLSVGAVPEDWHPRLEELALPIASALSRAGVDFGQQTLKVVELDGVVERDLVFQVTFFAAISKGVQGLLLANAICAHFESILDRVINAEEVHLVLGSAKQRTVKTLPRSADFMGGER